ncbi:MAG: Zn-ribbon domain-containing OB-fold protein [Candidatus Hydrogenedentes bacterium]|nr:Zn-ribbon domain-containing OB-fold protein [Candidatus Hydrogenedentota bacterium]
MDDDCFVVEGKMALPYQYFAGAVGSRFIVALRDEKKIFGVRCERCQRVLVPPRAFCDRCFGPLPEEWVEVGPEGVVTNFTVVRYREPYQPMEPPYVLALIQLDGADSSLAHLVNAPPETVSVGMRVRAVFAGEVRNNILQVAHFVPLEEKSPAGG